jgi:hypothetical protein
MFMKIVVVGRVGGVPSRKDSGNDSVRKGYIITNNELNLWQSHGTNEN